MAFYQKVFGWKFEQWEGPSPYWMVQTGGEGPGIDGGLRTRAHPGEGPMNTIDVPSCDEYLRKIDAAGGKTIVPKMPIPGVGWLAYCTDSEGNGFGIMQADESAAG
jgi:predicted enzyme related to lactoylglutathione lyase